MERLETVIDVGVSPLRSGLKVYASRMSKRDANLLQTASMVNPPVPLEIVTKFGVVKGVVSQERSLETFMLWRAT